MTDGDYAAARLHAIEEAAVAARAKNITATERIDAQADLAQIDVVSGDYALGVPSTRSALDACIRTLGAPAEGCVQLRRQLVIMLIRVGSESEALALLPSFEVEAANDLSPTRQLGAKAIILRILAANALWERAQGSSDAVKAALEKPFRDSNKMEAYLAVAEAAARRGDGAKAERALDDMEEAVKEIPADFHARALMIRGVAQQAQGKTDVALATLRQAARSYSAFYGAEHTQTLLCMLNQVVPLSSAGKRDEAKNLIVRTTVALRTRFPADAPLLALLSRPEAVLARAGHPQAPDAAPLFFN